MNTAHAMGKRSLTIALVGIGLAASVTLQPRAAGAVTVGAEIVVDAECVETCLTELGGCLEEARQDFTQCAIDGGCFELAATMRITCRPDTTASVCLEARAEYRDCISPCRSELRNDSKICRNEGLSCLHDECELSDLPEQCGRVRVTSTGD